MRATLNRAGLENAVTRHYREAMQLTERAALVATDKAANRLKLDIRGTMQGSGLGRLGNAIGHTSDLQKGERVRRRGAVGFSVSGTVFVRSKSERTLGAIEAYTEDADIRPRRGRWLWFPTDEIQRLVGSRSERTRMTPRVWIERGFDQKIGQLQFIEGVNGRPLAIVENAAVGIVSGRANPKGRTKTGKLRKGTREKRFLVAFIAIPATTRQARLNPRQMAEWQRNDLPTMVAQELARLRR